MNKVLVNLKAEMVRWGITYEMIGKIIGKTPRAVKNRVNGLVDFESNSMLVVRDTYFKRCSLDYLLGLEPVYWKDAS